MNSQEIIRLLTRDGWNLVRVNGSHHHYRHATKSGTVTVPHPKREIKKGTLNSILKQAGLKRLKQN
jgi:predicted RNA binding protein YcfA (HicA-like mRNA interferase family)